MKKNKRINKGFLLADLAVGLTVLGILIVCLALSLNAYRRFNHYQMVRQRCVAAAQAEIDSIAITGETISDEDMKKIWPKLSLSVERSDGDGQWQGLKLIKVTAKAKSFNKDVQIKLSRYLPVQGDK